MPQPIELVLLCDDSYSSEISLTVSERKFVPSKSKCLRNKTDTGKIASKRVPKPIKTIEKRLLEPKFSEPILVYWCILSFISYPKNPKIK